jgi:hypothetical protein
MEDDMGWGCSMHEKRDANRGLMGKPEGRRSLGRSRYRQEVIFNSVLEKLDGVSPG